MEYNLIESRIIEMVVSVPNQSSMYYIENVYARNLRLDKNLIFSIYNRLYASGVIFRSKENRVRINLDNLCRYLKINSFIYRNPYYKALKVVIEEPYKPIDTFAEGDENLSNCLEYLEHLGVISRNLVNMQDRSLETYMVDYKELIKFLESRVS